MLVLINKINCIYNMRSYENEIYIANTLRYIRLLPKEEQNIEMNKLLEKSRHTNKKTSIILLVLNLLKNYVG